MASELLQQSGGELPVRIPGKFFMKHKDLIFRNDMLEFNGVTIPYNQITGVCYKTIKFSVNAIPTAQTYVFKLYSPIKDIKIKYSSPFYIGNKKNEETFVRLVTASNELIEPLLIQRLLEQIFRENKEIKIDDVKINSQGYSVKKFFRGWVHVPWTDVIYTPEFRQGFVTLFKDDNGTGKCLGQIDMERDNAVLLPALIVGGYNMTR